MGVILERKKRILLNEPHIVTTAPAGVANFSTDLIAPLKSCKVEFSPVQAGTGDPSPENVRPISGWTGCNIVRTGKNIVDLGTQSFTHYKSIDLSYSIKAGKYKLSVTITSTDTDASTCLIGFWDKAGGSQIASYALSRNARTGANITLSKDCKRIYLYASNNYVSSDGDTATWQDIQIEIDSTYTTYEPYTGSTIPITFPATKNLFDENYEGITSSITYHSLYVGNEVVTASTTTPQTPNQYSNIFVFPGQVTTGAATGLNDIHVNRSRTITPIDGYITIAYRNSSGVDPREYHTQIERGTTATAYEPYGTIYGGYVDLVTGEVWKEQQIVEIQAAGKYGTWDSTTGKGAFWYTSGIHNLQSTNDGVLCERLSLDSNVSVDTNISCISWYTNGIVRWVELGNMEMTLNEYNAYLAENPLRVTYRLSTPQLVATLTPTQLKSLRGVNNIWSDANGDTTVKFWTH